MAQFNLGHTYEQFNRNVSLIVALVTILGIVPRLIDDDSIHLVTADQIEHVKPGPEPQVTSSTKNYLISVEHRTDQETGIEYEELAFKGPAKGIPDHVIEMYCVNIKLRLYWGQYRDETTEGQRKGTFLRRMARFARHMYEEIRDVDKPFEGPILSIIDKYFSATRPSSGDHMTGSCSKTSMKGTIRKINQLKDGLIDTIGGKSRKTTDHPEASAEEANVSKSSSSSDTGSTEDVMEASDAYNDIIKSGDKQKLSKVKDFLADWSQKVGIGIYTRIRTMWWVMMACLFAKYYLWDPALDEYVRLQRSLVMYPEIQLLKLQDLNCKPTMFFKRLLDVCKIMNPLMNIHFGQLSLDKTLRSNEKY